MEFSKGILLFVYLCVGHMSTFEILSVFDIRVFDEYEVAEVRHIMSELGDLYGVDIGLFISDERKADQITRQVCDKIDANTYIIFDMSGKETSKLISNIAHTLGVTHISSVDPSYLNHEDRNQVSVNVEPIEYILLNVIRDIVLVANLTNAAILYDHTFDLSDKPKRLLRNVAVQHTYTAMVTSSHNATRNQLTVMKNSGIKNMFMCSSAANAELYISQAVSLMMGSNKYNWYLLTKDSKFKCEKCGEKLIILLMKGQHNDLHQVNHEPLTSDLAMFNFSIVLRNFTITMKNQFLSEVLEIMSSTLYDLRRTGHLPTMNYSSCYDDNITNTRPLETSSIVKNRFLENGSTGYYGKYETVDNSTIRLNIGLDIFTSKFIDGGFSSALKTANWSQSTGVNIYHGLPIRETSKKFFRIVTVEEPPFVFISKQMPSNSDKFFVHKEGNLYYYGYCIDLIYHINATMGFDFEIFTPLDNAFGTLQSDGSWNGMINELIKDKADIIASTLAVMAERETVIDYTVPYYDLVGITVLMKKPKFEYSVFKFMSVLEEAVWGCIFSAFIIVSILLSVFDKFSPYRYQHYYVMYLSTISYQNNKNTWNGNGDEPRVFTLKEGLWFCMTSLTPQGGGEAPRALSGRLIAATWWVFGFIMIATYTANLAAFLTVSRLEQPIESLDDLAKQFKTKYAPQKSTSTETYFRRMADIEEKFYSIWKSMSLNDTMDQIERAKLAVWDYPVSDKFTNMWVAMKESGFPNNPVEAVSRIKQGGEDFAFIGDATQNKYAISTDCDLWEVGEEFSRKPYAFAVQKGNPLKDELSSAILQLLNKRVLEDLKTFWWDYERKECPKVEDESDGISIKNIGGVFLVIFIGIGMGLLTLAFEYYWYRLRPRNMNVSENPKEAPADGKKWPDNITSVTSYN